MFPSLMFRNETTTFQKTWSTKLRKSLWLLHGWWQTTCVWKRTECCVLYCSCWGNYDIIIFRFLGGGRKLCLGGERNPIPPPPPPHLYENMLTYTASSWVVLIRMTSWDLTTQCSIIINKDNPHFCRMTEMMSHCVETWVGNITALCDQYLTKTAGEVENNVDALKKLSQGNSYSFSINCEKS